MSERIGVVGGGVMGSGIAGVTAQYGVPVLIKEAQEACLAAGLEKARGVLRRMARRERSPAEDAQERARLLEGTVDDARFAAANPSLVIEAITENEEAKIALFEKLGKELAPRTIFASNTSVKSITRLARASGRPERFIGLHYFNPTDELPLVELVLPRTEGFTPEQLRVLDQTRAAALAFLEKTGRVPVVVRDSPGFGVNRVLLPYLNEAVRLVEEGASVERVDAPMKAFGFPMGPLELADHVGLGIAVEVGRTLERALPYLKLSGLFDRMLGKGRAGKSWGVRQGFYKYKEVLNRKSGQVRQVLLGADEDIVARGSRTDVGDREIEERLLFVLINEWARLLGEGVIASPGDADLSMRLGMGLSAAGGGLLRWADAKGLPAIVEGLRRLGAAGKGAIFEPAPFLVAKAGEGRGFYG